MASAAPAAGGAGAGAAATTNQEWQLASYPDPELTTVRCAPSATVRHEVGHTDHKSPGCLTPQTGQLEACGH